MNHFHVIELVSLVWKKNIQTFILLSGWVFFHSQVVFFKEWGLFVIKDQQSMGITPSTLEMLPISKFMHVTSIFAWFCHLTPQSYPDIYTEIIFACRWYNKNALQKQLCLVWGMKACRSSNTWQRPSAEVAANCLYNYEYVNRDAHCSTWIHQ